MTDGIHPSLLQRKIIHCDMDAFYASVEIRDNPSLRGKPVVIGGSPNSRSVVCTASYEARKFGIRSAMACSKAARLCPQAIFLPPDFTKYQEVSAQIHGIFHRYTDLVEPLSLDEAYLDVTSNKTGQFAVQIARQIQQDIWQELQLTGSAGVAPNKLVAKIASDIKKPAGLTIVLPAQVAEFMATMPLRKINGIGPVTDGHLQSAGLRLCSDVTRKSREELQQLLGSSMAEWLYDACRGIDERPVETSWERKSMGREDTFPLDYRDITQLHRELARLSQSVSEDLAEDGLQGKTVTVKVKYADFVQVTRRTTLKNPIHDADSIFELGRQLLERTEAGQRPVRLLGISLSGLQKCDV